MTSWVDHLAREPRTRQWAIIVRIEGVGPFLSDADLTTAGNDGRTRFCVSIPSYAAAHPAGLWRPYLHQLPELLNERPDELGGLTELSGAQVEIVDREDYLTQQLRTERRPSTTLESAMNAVAGNVVVNVGSGAGLLNQVLYIGSEAFRCTAVTGNTVTLARGYIGTDVVRHEVGDRIYLSVPYTKGRRVEVHVAPLDGDSAADERLAGAFVFDTKSFSEDLNAWILAVKGQLAHLSRLAPIRPRQLTVTSVREGAAQGSGYIYLEPEAGRGVSSYRLWTNTGVEDLFYLRRAGGKEVFTVRSDHAIGRAVITHRRGVVGTQVEEIKEGDLVHQVFVAEPEVPGSFRYSPGPTPSTNRATGTWTPTAHWLDLLLIVLFSSADETDGLELTNYISARGNFSSLPPGFGIGQPAAGVDWDAVDDVRQRTADYDLPFLSYGDRPASFGEWVTENMLRPMGAYFSRVTGTVRVVLPRLPLSGAASITLGAADLLARQVGQRQYQPRIQVRDAAGTHERAIAYLIGPQGTRRTYGDGQFEATYGQRGYYGIDDKPIEIAVPGGDPSSVGLWEARGGARLFRTHKPRIEILGDWDPEQTWDLRPGDLVAVTLNELPDQAAGARGWTSVSAQVVEAGPQTEDLGVYVSSRMVAYGPSVRVARIAPSARVYLVAGNTVTIASVVYTQSDAAGGLPTTDAAAFTVGQVVRLMNLDGTSAAAGTQTITAISGDDITLSGNFGGALAAGRVIVLADYDEAIQDTRNRFAHWGNAATQSVGAAADDPYVYGEP